MGKSCQQWNKKRKGHNRKDGERETRRPERNGDRDGERERGEERERGS